MSIIRWALGRIILFFNWVFTPRARKLSQEQKSAFDQDAQTLALYQFLACPFCVKVRREIKRLNLNIVTRDAKNEEQYKQELVEQGGHAKVPCLRIADDNGEPKWLYESSDIIKYLQQRFVA